MFRVVEEQGTLTVLHHDRPLLRKMTVWTTSDGDGSGQLTLQAVSLEQGAGRLGEEASYTCAYADSTGQSVVTLTFHSSANTLSARVDAVLPSESAIKRHKHYDAWRAIVIRVGDIGEVSGLVASYQHKDWWTRPSFHPDIRKLPPRTQSLLWQARHGNAYLLPVCDDVYRTDLSGTNDGLEIRLFSADGGHNACHSLAFVLGAGDDPFQLVEDTTRTAAKRLNVPVPHRLEKRYPEVFEYLGWCSWDAFYHEVNQTGVLAKVQELISFGVPVKWLMIDDGWLSVRRERLHALVPDEHKFPNGFGELTEQLKGQYGISWVGVWHTLFGYWGGIDEESPLARDAQPYLYATDNGHTVPYPDPVKGFGFWNMWHKRLREQGIDFVKVDGQSGVQNFFAHSMAVGKAAAHSHAALEASVATHFCTTVINCMGMAAENFWHRPISAVSRSSDDFVPNEEGSFVEHVLQNVYNSVYHGQLYWGDWDMFWTVHPQSVHHAVLRAVSGGPIYVSDPVGKTDPQNIWPLILNDGRILRCDQPGLPTADCLFTDPRDSGRPLKVWNTANGSGVVAAFHLGEQDAVVSGQVGPQDISGLSGQRFAIYDHFQRTVQFVDRDQRIDFALAADEFALYLVVPVEHTCEPLGLIDKYISSAAISYTHHASDRTLVCLAGGGTFAFLSQSVPKAVRVNGCEQEVTLLGPDSGLYVVDCQKASGQVEVEVLYPAGGES
ncbi:Sip1-related alpha-galactosidase [Alicyclobacillus fastidiosus]|uniref:Sip1-related alpha-galactosidase n=1 Tax=Alicyclobacillus fastidiosus TaxID=392011 RepID=A0ABV5AAB4_9BACL|nr:Sip1-related alpha-galactosidase [Alicyclobacillus fastidiosus]WEH07718.1 Sip1-related alpha-galactosidase [Alicyclobacillus fastidiosus]